MSELAGYDAIENDKQQAGTQSQADTQRGKKAFFVGIAPVGHEKNQTRCETGDKRYHEQHNQCLEHQRCPCGSRCCIGLAAAREK